MTAQEADIARREWLDPDRGTVTVSVWVKRWIDGPHMLKPKTAVREVG